MENEKCLNDSCTLQSDRTFFYCQLEPWLFKSDLQLPAGHKCAPSPGPQVCDCVSDVFIGLHSLRPSYSILKFDEEEGGGLCRDLCHENGVGVGGSLSGLGVLFLCRTVVFYTEH